LQTELRNIPKGEPEEAERLWKEFAQSRSLELRNELVMYYVPLVKTIALRMMPSYRKHVEFDDLMSSGLLGLMDAVDKFDPSKDVKFETYATLRIKGEIVDQIRKQDWAPISLRQKIKKVEEAYDTIEAKTGKSPSDQAVAEHLHMSTDEVQKVLGESHTFNLIALDEMLVDRLGWDRMPMR